MIVLKGYQKKGIEFLHQKRFASILADDMGLGKTIQAIIASESISGKILIVCPKSVKENWKYHIQNNLDFKLVQVLNRTEEEINQYADYYICSYNYLSTNIGRLRGFTYGLVVFDESHYLKSLDAKRTWSALGNQGIIRVAKKVWFLSGTPLTSTPFDLYPTIITCFPNEFKNYLDEKIFLATFTNFYYDKWRQLRIISTKNSELFSDILSKVMLRREKKEVAEQLEKVVIEEIFLEKTFHVEELLKEQEKNQEKSKDIKMGMGLLSKDRNKLAIKKAELSLEYIIEAQEQEKVIVFYHHKCVLEYMIENFREQKKSLNYIDGSVSSEKRQEIIKHFSKSSNCNTLMAQISAIGTGTDGLQENCSRAIFLELPWLSTEFDQAVSRLDRLGQKNPVAVQILLFENSLDQRVFRSMSRKDKNIKEVINKIINRI